MVEALMNNIMIYDPRKLYMIQHNAFRYYNTLYCQQRRDTVSSSNNNIYLGWLMVFFKPKHWSQPEHMAEQRLLKGTSHKHRCESDLKA